MWQDVVVVSLWGGFVALDTTAAMQILISRPLVSCSVVGLLLGSFAPGFIIGLMFELIYLDELPVGGALFNEGNLGATIAAGLAILLSRESGRPDLAVPLAALAGLLTSKAGAHIVVALRTRNTEIYTRLIERPRITSGAVTRAHLHCLLLMFAAGVVLTFTALVLFFFIFRSLIPLIPAGWDAHLRTLIYAFLGVGCAVLLYIFYERKRWWLFAAGLGLGLLVWLFTAAGAGGGL
ncbi:MAG TPA: PTS sugar transporter subunit IIC [bacterium]|nr:PTS sugar transporter subunit IIC [bacterium]HOZ22898.1 PTS sugar transporter subunit IIC [bacterium]